MIFSRILKGIKNTINYCSSIRIERELLKIIEKRGRGEEIKEEDKLEFYFGKSFRNRNYPNIIRDTSKRPSRDYRKAVAAYNAYMDITARLEN